MTAKSYLGGNGAARQHSETEKFDFRKIRFHSRSPTSRQRPKSYRGLSPDVEEGICQVLAHMWLDSEILSGSASTISSSSSSSSTPSSKKGTRSQFERKLGDFFKHQIESDSSPAYGDGFRAANEAVLKYGLRSTLDHIRLTASFPL